MATNQAIESPDFDAIRSGDKHAVENAIRLLWFVANNEIRTRRQADRRIEERLSPLTKSMAPTTGQNNLDTEGAGMLLFTGSTSVTITGLRSREEGDIVFLHNIGSGTITLSHLSGSSDSGNQMAFQALANKAVATGQSVILMYLSGLWREWSAA